MIYKYNFIILLFLLLNVASENRAQYVSRSNSMNTPLLLDESLQLSMSDLQSSGQYDSIDTCFYKKNIIRMDRWACCPMHHEFDWMSDITLTFCTMYPYFISFKKRSQWDARIDDYLVIFESQLLTSGIVYLTKLLINRPRPYVYYIQSQDLSHLSQDAFNSFFSGHASLAFTSIFVAGQIHRHNMSKTEYQRFCIAGLSIATCTSIFRVLAGKHFPTDIITGILVGIMIGISMPQIQ